MSCSPKSVVVQQPASSAYGTTYEIAYYGPMNTLAAGATQPYSDPNIVVPISIPPGDYYVTTFVDTDQQVSESNESNNIGSSSPTRLTVGITPTKIISLSGSLAFGSVAVGASLTSTLTIANMGNSALTVSSISYPAGFTGSWTSGTIAAVGSQPVTVTFSPTSAASYSGTITVNSDKTSGVNTIAASGTGTSTSTRQVFGIVWNDADGDRMLDEGEQSLSGWTVYADLNGNGNRDDGEPFTVTDANGNYKLTGLSTGPVDVRLEMQSQFTQTLPGAAGADPGSFLQIQLNYLDDKLSASQRAIVASAVARWQEMLLTSLPLQIEVEVTGW